jgi:hypothetical protein
MTSACDSPQADQTDEVFWTTGTQGDGDKVGAPSFANSNNNPVMSNVTVVGVAWGNVNRNVAAMAGFFEDVLKSPYMTWLDEYSIPGKPIGRGSFKGLFDISPQNPNVSLNDSDFQNELRHQIAHGLLPPNDANTLYVVYLPLGAEAHYPDGDAMGKCSGYHWFGNSGSLVYAIITDDPSCDDGTYLSRVSSHELIEAITDPQRNGWSDSDDDELADFCDAYAQLAIPEHADRSYSVAKIYDTETGSCIVQKSFQSADILVANDSSEYIWKLSNGDYYSTVGNTGLDLTRWQFRGTADINADGISDLVWWNQVSGEVGITFINEGNALNDIGVVGSATLDWSLEGVADVR